MTEKVHTLFGNSRIYSQPAMDPERFDGEPHHILLVPGYTEGLSHLVPVADALAAEGFDVTAFNQPRMHGNGLHQRADELDRAAGVITSIMNERLQGKNVTAVGHSMGVPAVLRAASSMPGRFDRIIGMEPLGFSKPQPLGVMAVRAGFGVVQNISDVVHHRTNENVTRRIRAGHRSSARFISKNLLLALAEGNFASGCGIAEDLLNVDAQEVPIHVVLAHSDILMPQHEVTAMYVSAAETLQHASLSAVVDPRARHDEFWLNVDRTAKIVSQLIPRVLAMRVPGGERLAS